MISEEIENSLLKFLNKQANLNDLELLEKWAKKKGNKKIFREYIKINYAVDYQMNDFNSDVIINKIAALKVKENRLKVMKNTRVFLKYAAIIILTIATTIYYFIEKPFDKPNTTDAFSKNTILRTETGEIKVLATETAEVIKDKNGLVLGEVLQNSIKHQKSTSVNKLVYNTITVPYGKKFKIELSDGTVVNLNSGTSFKYPINFINGKNREVFIENGEAYFNVTKDSKHPFIVNNNGIDIKVLGTQFNVSAYPEDKTITTVLVEGSIQLLKNNKITSQKTTIEPGYKAVFDKKTESIQVSDADLEVHMAWLNGKIIFKHQPFKDIIKKIERHYDVSIKNSDEVLHNEQITASFDKESLKEFLEVINKLHPINYEINGRNVTIRKINNY